MRGNLLGLFFLLKYCMCDNVQNFDGDIRDFVVGNSKLFVLTDRRLHQMTHDLSLEKTKDFIATHPNVTLLVPFEANRTLITCGTSNGGYCEVLDLNDITNSIYWEQLSTVPQANEKSIAFIVDSTPNGAYLLVGKKEFSQKDSFYSIVTLWNTLNSQQGSIFCKIGDGDTPYIHTTRDVEFIDGFQIISLKFSYLFLNAKNEFGCQAFALRLNNDRTKDGILKDIYGTMLKCCNDQSRPVLVASALIPSDKDVIWTGVFSAENDPEDTALAVYDLSNVDDKLKDFCSKRNKPCHSENDHTREPVAVVFKYKSMSSVAADRSESWIVLFIGTKDGQLIKVVLDEKFSPGCPTVLYRSHDDQKVLPRMHLDPVDNKHIYIALKNQMRRVPVVQCVKHSSLKDCRAALDPLCGWCVETRRCSTQDECLISSWISFPNNIIQKPLLSFQVADKSSREMTLHLTLSLDSTRNPAIFSCTFTTAGVNLCDRSDPAIIFPNCFCDFSDQHLNSGGLEILATVTVDDQKITETLMLKNCPTITENSPKAYYAKCVQCVSAGCHWSSSVKRCDWTHGPEPQLHIQDVCKDLHSDTEYKEAEIFSIEPNRVSFHGRNNVLLTGRNLGSVTKIRIQWDLDCFPKESPVFDRSSDSLRFHVPPSETKGTAKVCAVTEDDRCHGNSIITYSSQPSCTEIQPKVTWRSGGRKIHIQGNNMEFVESVIIHPLNKELKTQYDTSSKDLWFYTHPYDGNGLINIMLKVGNVSLDCASLTQQPDPEFIGFTTAPIDNDVLVIIKKNADQLNLSMNEVKVSGLQGNDEYDCVLEKISSQTITCLIKGALISVDSVTIRVGKSFGLTMGQSSTKYLFCIRPQDTSG